MTPIILAMIIHAYANVAPFPVWIATPVNCRSECSGVWLSDQVGETGKEDKDEPLRQW